MKERRPARTLAALGLLAALAFLLHVGIGSYLLIAPGDLLREIAAGPGGPGTINSVVWDTRLPRAVLCLLSGGLLGAVGSAFQALFRNPLADPYIVGVSSGAAVGGAIAVVAGFGTAFGGLGIAAAGFVTGLATLVVVHRLSQRRGVVDVRTLLLGGVVIGSLLSSVLSLILLMAGKDTNDVLRWLLGNTSLATWEKNAMLAVVLVIGTFVLIRESRLLNAFALGSDTATRLGIDVPRLTRVVLIVGGAMAAAAVGTVGVVGFLGLVAPHIARRILGVDWRWSLPGSLVVGALLLTASDIVAQRAVGLVTHQVGMDLPVGIVTSLLGAPSLLILLRRQG